MVFTYTGITRVLWGSLPSEGMFHEEKRTIHSSQMSYSGRQISMKKDLKKKDFFSLQMTLITVV
jgi:hypothetical protein